MIHKQTGMAESHDTGFVTSAYGLDVACGPLCALVGASGKEEKEGTLAKGAEKEEVQKYSLDLIL